MGSGKFFLSSPVSGTACTPAAPSVPGGEWFFGNHPDPGERKAESPAAVRINAPAIPAGQSPEQALNDEFYFCMLLQALLPYPSAAPDLQSEYPHPRPLLLSKRAAGLLP